MDKNSTNPWWGVEELGAKHPHWIDPLNYPPWNQPVHINNPTGNTTTSFTVTTGNPVLERLKEAFFTGVITEDFLRHILDSNKISLQEYLEVLMENNERSKQTEKRGD